MMERVIQQRELSRAQESKSMANVTIWKEGQNLLSLHNSWENLGRLEGYMLDRRILCNPHLSLALFNVKGQTQNGIVGKQFLYCYPKLWETTGAPQWLPFIWSFLLQEKSYRCSSNATEVDGTLWDSSKHLTYCEQMCPRGSLFLLGLHTGLG